MKEFNLINLGNIGEPAAKVANNFIDKIASALGWFFTPKNIKPAIIEANNSIIEEIRNREDISPIERAIIVNSYERMVKEYINQIDIVKVAFEHLNADFKSENVKEDWIIYFFDKVKNVNEDYMKSIWGKILAGEFNEPNTYSKQFLHTMSIMDSTLANRFQKIRSAFFYSSPCLYAFIYRRNGKDINNIKNYQDLGISIDDLRELDNIGLIEYRVPNFYTWSIKNKSFEYGNKLIVLNTDKNIIEFGNVWLTNMGKQLCKISPMVYSDEILEICLDSWRKLGYNPSVELIEKK